MRPPPTDDPVNLGKDVGERIATRDPSDKWTVVVMGQWVRVFHGPLDFKPHWLSAYIYHWTEADAVVDRLSAVARKAEAKAVVR